MRGPISPTLTIAALALGAAGPASAQTADGEWQTKAEAVLVAGAIDDGDPIAPAGDVLLGSAMVEVARSDTFENGLTLGWLGAARFERDADTRLLLHCDRVLGPFLPSDTESGRSGTLAGKASLGAR